MSFTWTSLISPEYPQVVTAAIVTTGLVGVGLHARKSLGTGQGAVVPAGRVSVRGFFETITEFITELADSVIGSHGRAYVPLFASLFTFILINNLTGILPGVVPATENLNTTLAMGLFVFVAYNIIGLKTNGISYLKHFMGPVWYLIPLMLPIEIISNCLRPLTLGLRLSNVLRGDHMVVGVFTDLIPLLIPIPFYALGLIVALVQAFVFTLLSMVYVSLATAHEH